jgi:uroporphyrinogen-III synthase
VLPGVADMQPAPRVVVTRPASQAAAWVERLRQNGVDAVALPLIMIAPSCDRATLEGAWQSLAMRRLVVFVSPNAALQFFAVRPAGLQWPAQLDAAAPGPGTAGVLLELGIPPERIIEPAEDAPQFDSEALWPRLDAHDWKDADVLLVRGETGRNWLAERLRGRGAQVEALAAYRNVAPPFDAAARALLESAATAPRRHLWLFSSATAIDHLEQWCAAAALTPWIDGRAIATHGRIAVRAQRLGFRAVHEVRPTWDAVLACIQSSRT